METLSKELVENEYGMPWEVIALIGQKRLEDLGGNFPSKLTSALRTLKNWYDKNGLEWIRENQKNLQNALVELERM